MRIYYISDSTIPSQKANSIQVLQMCEAFAQRAGDLLLFARQGSDNVPDVHAYYGISAEFPIRAIRLPRARIIDRLFYAYAVAIELRRRPRADVIYAREYFATGIASLLHPKTRVVLEVHSPAPNRFWQWWMRRMFARKNFSHLVTISEALATDYLRRYADLDRTRVIVAHDGAPASTVQLGQAPADRGPEPLDRRPRLGYVGSLRPGKGMELISRLAPLIPECELHVVGGDALSVESWRARAAFPNLLFHGFKPPSETERCIAGFDVLLAPYQPAVLVGRGDVDISAWMSPLKIFEYMRARKPIVASDLPVLREILEDGRNAVLADALNPEDWAARIRQLLQDGELGRRLAGNAREEFCRRYTWDKRAERILTAISLDTRPHRLPRKYTEGKSNGPAPERARRSIFFRWRE